MLDKEQQNEKKGSFLRVINGGKVEDIEEIELGCEVFLNCKKKKGGFYEASFEYEGDATLVMCLLEQALEKMKRGC